MKQLVRHRVRPSDRHDAWWRRRPDAAVLAELQAIADRRQGVSAG